MCPASHTEPVSRRTAVTRRPIPGSPFAPPPPRVSAKERFTADDRVTHDRYGLGTVVRVLDDELVAVKFRSSDSPVCVTHVKLTRL